MQLRKLDKERLSFVCETKNISKKQERLVEALKNEKIQLQDRLNAISIGPHAQRELKVRPQTILIYHTSRLLTPNLNSFPLLLDRTQNTFPFKATRRHRSNDQREKSPIVGAQRAH